MLLAISESMKFLLESSLIVMLFCTFFANVGVHLMRGITSLYIIRSNVQQMRTLGDWDFRYK